MGYIKRFFVFLCLSLFLSSPFVFFQYYLTDKILPLKIIPYFAFVVSLLLLRLLSLQRQENNFMRIFSWSIFSLASILVFLLGQITFYLKRIYAQTGSFEPVLVFSQNKPLPFFLTWLNFTDTLLAFTISGAFLVLIYIAGSEKIFKRIAIKPLLSYSLFAMLLVPIFFLPFRFELSHIFLKTYVAYQSDRQFFLSFNTDSLVYSNDLGTKKENGEVYVLVIDQNVSRTHMEAFGGGRKTTPWLSSQKENPNWIFFSQGYSSSPNPSIALLNLLSNSELEKSGSSHSANSLISLFKSANFDVANFMAYRRSVLAHPYRLDSDYLIIGYRMTGNSLEIADVWLKKVWEITGPSEDWPLKCQVKQGEVVNIRPAKWYNTHRTKFKTFNTALEFITAFDGTQRQWTRTERDALTSTWLKSVVRGYKASTGNDLV